MTNFIAVTQGANYQGENQGGGYIRASAIISVLPWMDTRDDNDGKEIATQGTIIRYCGVSGEMDSVFVLETPDEIFKRLQTVTQSDKRETAQEWIDVFVNNLPAIESAFKALNNR